MLIRRTVTPKRVLAENILLNPEVFFQAGILPITIPIPICLLLSQANCLVLILSHFLTLNNDASTHFSAGKVVPGARTALHCSPHALQSITAIIFELSLRSEKKTYISLKSGAVLKSGRNTIRNLSDNQGWRLRCNVCVLVINDFVV